MAIALFPFKKTDHRRYRMLRRNRDAQVHLVRHPVPLHNLAFFLLRQRVEYRTQLSPDIPKNRLPPSLGHEHNVVLAVPLGVG